MAVTTKESLPSSPLPENPATNQNAAPQAAQRTDPIGVEIPVVVHASRYSAATKGTGKPMPPVHEETKTVIVFAQGAVVRLTANLAVGETVVLTNQQTGADVLCRVGSVKAQPGIQNYIDLEFTQRAPGFWNNSSSADSPARSGSTVSEDAPKPAPTFLPVTTSSAPVSSAATPLSALEPSLPSPKPAPKSTPAEPPSVAAIDAQPVSEASPAPSSVSARPSSSTVSGISAGMRQPTSNPKAAVIGGGLEWTKETPAGSKKGLLVAATILGVAALASGAYVLTHRQPAVQPAEQAAVATPSVPVEPPQQPPSDASPSLAPTDSPTAVADSASVTDERRAESPSATSRGSAPATSAKPVPKPSESTTQSAQQSLHPAVLDGSLKTPIRRRAAVAGSSEPPPMLSLRDASATPDILGAGALVAPAPPTVAPGPVKEGGQLQMPKVISSPPPIYPEIARSQGIGGVVAVDALIDATGAVADVKVTSGPVLLRQAAMDALRKWKYQPARLNGQPTSVHVNVNVDFTAH